MIYEQINIGLTAGTEIVQTPHFISEIQNCLAKVRSDKTCSSRNEK